MIYLEVFRLLKDSQHRFTKYLPLCLWLQLASSVWSWQFDWPSQTDTDRRQRPLSHINSSLEQLPKGKWNTHTYTNTYKINNTKNYTDIKCFDSLLYYHVKYNFLLNRFSVHTIPTPDPFWHSFLFISTTTHSLGQIYLNIFYNLQIRLGD